MFGWGAGLTVATTTAEPEKERKPPAQPTPLDFPIYKLPDAVQNEADSTLHDFQNNLAGIKSPQDISHDRFKPLNLQVESDVDVSRMFPDDQARSLPPVPWQLDETQSGDAPRPQMSNGLPYPAKERFDILQRELVLDDDDVFREVARLPQREGRERVRVTQTRKFWAGLEHMAQYWDKRLDHYYEKPASPKQTPTDGESKGVQDQDQNGMDTDEQPDTIESKMEVDGPTESVYTGRRVDAGSEMPDDMRDETIRAFIEMAAWPFGCQVTIPPLAPRLMVKSLLFPVRQTFQAARSPRDRQVARSGILEGPVLIAQCRPETSFRSENDTPGEALGDMCDVFREVGGMLLAAQERAREGLSEQRPGEGKWWTTTARFGGAPHDEILDDLVTGPGMHGMPLPDSMVGEDDASTLTGTSESAPKRHKYEHPFVTSLNRRPSAMRKMTSSEKWKILQPGPGLWDKRMKYMQIGKAKDSPFDDIYMVSSINHHISILHLRVHKRYIDVLSSGKPSTQEQSNDGQPWHVLKLQRTRWYDLFDANDRVEALKGVWSLFHYQLRTIPDVQTV
ncbi:hypothetical protein N7495_003195 [Penicillium taxi]|uniref:uncharacterized protein n=1 Tax=Penicillium taxi TaxID=168475 RepID=UPI002545353E|nr:uncharacterized protein N7495_003195 [Penicillium taxi]KAJ5902667.1 hypothetical protein N7495_003195 [Penicillium taxi]